MTPMATGVPADAATRAYCVARASLTPVLRTRPATRTWPASGYPAPPGPRLMAYRVKELFGTLQGEGMNVGRAAVFCRFSGCNLWTGT